MASFYCELSLCPKMHPVENNSAHRTTAARLLNAKRVWDASFTNTVFNITKINVIVLVFMTKKLMKLQKNWHKTKQFPIPLNLRRKETTEGRW